MSHIFNNPSLPEVTTVAASLLPSLSWVEVTTDVMEDSE
jgi:hypothetical protein